MMQSMKLSKLIMERFRSQLVIFAATLTIQKPKLYLYMKQKSFLEISSIEEDSDVDEIFEQPTRGFW